VSKEGYKTQLNEAYIVNKTETLTVELVAEKPAKPEDVVEPTVQSNASCKYVADTGDLYTGTGNKPTNMQVATDGFIELALGPGIVKKSFYPESVAGKYEFELGSLQINYLKETYDEDKVLDLPSKRTAKVRQLRVSDELRVANFKKTNANSAQSFDEDFLTVASVIYELDGKSVGLIEAYDFITNASPEDYAYIVSYINHFDFGVDPETPVKCAKCGGETTVSVSFRPDFFVPKYKFE
jgi:hypothetical protein